MSALALSLLAACAARAQLSPEALRVQGAGLFEAARPPLGPAAGPRPLPLPPAVEGTMALSELAQELAADPARIDALLAELVWRLGRLGQSWDAPERRAALAAALKSADKSFLDRFPVLTPAQLLAGASAFAAAGAPPPAEEVPAEETLVLTGEPREPAPDAFSVELLPGLRRGDEAAARRVPYGDSLALARALNRLAANDPEAPAYTLRVGRRRLRCVASFLGYLLNHGTRLEVRSRRFYANFGDLRWKGRDVATPVYVDTGLTLPSGRRLVVPVSHNQLDVSLRGRVNADLSFFFGIDGSADFRADATRDQAWVGGRTTASWSSHEAAALLARAARVRRALAAKAAAAGLPLGGYGPLGGCNDAHAFVTGQTPYPLLRDPRAFAGGSWLDAVSGALPYDAAAPADARRIHEARPFDDPADIPLPEVRAAMLELQAALR